MQKTNLAIIASLLLSACATTLPPATKVITQRVEIPIPVQCTTPEPKVPDFCWQKLSPNDDVFIKVRCMLSDQELHRGYENDLSAALKSCK